MFYGNQSQGLISHRQGLNRGYKQAAAENLDMAELCHNWRWKRSKSQSVLQAVSRPPVIGIG